MLELKYLLLVTFVELVQPLVLFGHFWLKHFMFSFYRFFFFLYRNGMELGKDFGKKQTNKKILLNPQFWLVLYVKIIFNVLFFSFFFCTTVYIVWTHSAHCNKMCIKTKKQTDFCKKSEYLGYRIVTSNLQGKVNVHLGVCDVIYSSHLVLAGPEGADGQLHLMPLPPLRAGHIPHSISPWATIYTHIHAQAPGTVSITAIQKITELHTVCVVLTQRT